MSNSSDFTPVILTAPSGCDDAGFMKFVSENKSVIEKCTQLYCGCITDDSIEFIVASFPNLLTLDLKNSKITNFGLEHFFNSKLAQNTITSLSLPGCKQLSDFGFEQISKMKRLTALDVSQIDICEDALRSISSLRATLECLSLEHCFKISNLENVAKLSALTSLDLSENYRISNLEPISQLTHLSFLNLKNCTKVGDESLPHVAKLPALKILILENCDEVTDEGLYRLSFSRSLNELSLSGCSQITDDGLEFLLKLTSLKLLHLENIERKFTVTIPNCQILQ